MHWIDKSCIGNWRQMNITVCLPEMKEEQYYYLRSYYLVPRETEYYYCMYMQ